VRYRFAELSGEHLALPRPVIPIQLENASLPCLVDTGAIGNRFGASLADAAGIELADAPAETIVVGGVHATARHARARIGVAGTSYDAPVAFCDPWPFGFGLLGQEGFLRFFRVTLCARDLWLDVEPEDWS
jgi:hypothetical protein